MPGGEPWIGLVTRIPQCQPDGVADRNRLKVPVDGAYSIPRCKAVNRPTQRDVCREGDASSTTLFLAMCPVVRLLLLIGGRFGAVAR